MAVALSGRTSRMHQRRVRFHDRVSTAPTLCGQQPPYPPKRAAIAAAPPSEEFAILIDRAKECLQLRLIAYIGSVARYDRGAVKAEYEQSRPRGKQGLGEAT